jgi:hypothetical protein
MLACIAAVQRIGHPILGYIIPAVIFGFSFFIAFYLYKHFTKQMQEDNQKE